MVGARPIQTETDELGKTGFEYETKIICGLGNPAIYVVQMEQQAWLFRIDRNLEISAETSILIHGGEALRSPHQSTDGGKLRGVKCMGTMRALKCRLKAVPSKDTGIANLQVNHACVQYEQG